MNEDARLPLPLGVSEADWQMMTRALKRVYEDADRVLVGLASRRCSTARRIARYADLDELNVLAALVLLEQLELVHVEPEGDDLVVVLHAIPLACERVIDADGRVRWLCVSKSVGWPD